MTVCLDSSALIARYLDAPEHDPVVMAMEADHEWCASALVRTEVVALIERIAADHGDRVDMRAEFERDWERFAIVPVDAQCLARAGELLSTHPLRMIDALHLAAADRLPRPLTFVTFDHHQIPVALALGFEVVST
jgi:predicted nucleic acid-binding protein